MTLNEFKYWLDGYTASINVVPTKEQWHLIRQKMDEIHIPSPINICNCSHVKVNQYPWSHNLGMTLTSGSGTVSL